MTSSVQRFLDRVGAPMPWGLGTIWSRGEECHAVADKTGRKLDLRLWDNEADARRMTALTAIAPEAMDYVERAAAKGGLEAKAILDRFEAMASTRAGRLRS